MNSTVDRVVGVLLGLAAGDRNGGPINMAVRLAESLLAQKRFDPHDIGARYLQWWREGAFDTGPTAARVFSLVDAGKSFEEASSRVHDEYDGMTAGCNPAHRVAPLAMSVHLEDSELTQCAQREASLTHRHPLAADVSSAVVLLCRHLIRGAGWDDARRAAAVGRSSIARASLEPGTQETLNAGGFAPDVLAAAVCFLEQHGEFGDALEASIRFAGPANYCPVLVGSIGGARSGASQIGEHHLGHCPLLDRVRAAAGKLVEEWGPE
jgi:ADP-ribosylglycohydrolase